MRKTRKICSASRAGPVVGFILYTAGPLGRRRLRRWVMCGIVGYIGKRQATDICVQSLRSMEYRGYDSAGVAVITDSGELVLRRAVGKLDNLQDMLTAEPIVGSLGLG